MIFIAERLLPVLFCPSAGLDLLWCGTGRPTPVAPTMWIGTSTPTVHRWDHREYTSDTPSLGRGATPDVSPSPLYYCTWSQTKSAGRLFERTVRVCFCFRAFFSRLHCGHQSTAHLNRRPAWQTPYFYRKPRGRNLNPSRTAFMFLGESYLNLV